jgi:hypothetical protein
VTHTIVLPFTRPLITANEARSKAHWRTQHAAKLDVHTAVGVLVKANKIPQVGRCEVELTWHRKDGRLADAGCLTWMMKAAVDGLVVAGVLPRDDARFVVAETCRVVLSDPPARLVLEIREVP